MNAEQYYMSYVTATIRRKRNAFFRNPSVVTVTVTAIKQPINLFADSKATK